MPISGGDQQRPVRPHIMDRADVARLFGTLDRARRNKIADSRRFRGVAIRGALNAV
jgi:hypothetical protein